MLIELPGFFDTHVHVRTGVMLTNVLPFTASYSSAAVIMPNTRPHAILTGSDAVRYRDEEIMKALPFGSSFRPVMTIEIRDDTTLSMIENALFLGVSACKVYPRGLTTNAEYGLSDFLSKSAMGLWEKIADMDMLLLVHGECDGHEIDLTRREETFLPQLVELSRRLPYLRMVMEHVSSRKGIETILSLGTNVAGGITAHHLYLTLNDILGSGVNPHLACMPTPKYFDDRNALREVVLSGNPKFFLGSDSAPHLRKHKECSKGACGVFSAPVLASVLVQFFLENNKLHLMENFTSGFGANFYRMELPPRTISLQYDPWVVPNEYHGIVPFWAGQSLDYQLVIT